MNPPRNSKKRVIEKIESTNKRGFKKKVASDDDLNDLLDNTDNPSQNKSTGVKRGRKKNDHDDNLIIYKVKVQVSKKVTRKSKRNRCTSIITNNL